MKKLEHWQLETFADVHKLTYPPPQWSTAALERAAKPALWVSLTSMHEIVKNRPSVCPMPISWALNWMDSNCVTFMHLPTFDCGFVGVGIFPRSQPCLVYDKERLIEVLMEETEDYTLAVSLFESKLSKAYYGNGSPGFLTAFLY